MSRIRTDRYVLCGCLLAMLLYHVPLWAAAVWVVDTPTSRVYLAGSIHVLRDADYPLPLEFETAFQEAKQLYFETNLDEMAQPRFQEELLKRGQYSGTDSLARHVQPGTLAKLKLLVEEQGIPFESVEKFRPWFLSLALLSNELQRLGISFEAGVDPVLNRRAKEAGKATFGLVPTMEHIEIISTFGNDTNDMLVTSAIEEISEIGPTVESIIHAWRKGDDDALVDLLVTPTKKEFPKLYELVLKNRNARWIATIERIIKSNTSTMIVVGTGHLVGPDSVIAMLTQRGYRVTKFAPKASRQTR